MYSHVYLLVIILNGSIIEIPNVYVNMIIFMLFIKNIDNMFTLKQLAIFDAVARLGSVSEAADSLAMTQPAASMALQQLESILETELFVRAQKRMSLTPQGKVLQPLARSMLNNAHEIKLKVNPEVGTMQLRIGASPTIGDYMLNQVCSEFMRLHPECRLSVSVMPAFDVINKIDEMAIDVGLIEFITIRPTLNAQRWREESLTVFCSPKNALAKKMKLKLANLAGQRWCLQHRFADSRRQFTLEVLKRIPSIDIVMESDSVPLIIKSVEDDVGLSCLPRPCIEKELNTGSLVELKVPELELTVPFSIVSHKLVKGSELQSQFVEMVQSLAAE